MNGISERIEVELPDYKASKSEHDGQGSWMADFPVGVLMYRWFLYVNLLFPCLAFDIWRRSVSGAMAIGERAEQGKTSAAEKAMPASPAHHDKRVDDAVAAESGDQALDQKRHLHAGSAKQTWSQLTEEELLQTEGDLRKLRALLQQRYGISGEAADKQIKGLLDHVMG